VREVFKKYKETKNIFCPILEYEYEKNEHHFLFYVNIYHTLDKIVQEKPKIRCTEFFRALEPIATLHKATTLSEAGNPIVTEIENKLSELSGGKISKLEEITPEICAKKFVHYADYTNYLSSKEKEKLEKTYFELVSQYFVSKCLIQDDGYPWHISLGKPQPFLIDAGEIAIGPASRHLACAFGYFFVYNKLNQEGIDALIYQYSNNLTNNSENEEKIKDGFYAFAAYTNYRLSRGTRGAFGKKKKALFRAVAIQQLFVLGKKEKSAEKIARLLLKVP
jgi:hypothetical protein